LVLVDQQAGLAFGVGSIDRQMLLNNVIALARTATVFGMPWRLRPPPRSTAVP
jgi:nicotinamidase-related amidase